MAYRYYAELKLSCLNCGQLLAIRTSSATDLGDTIKLVSDTNTSEIEHSHGCVVKESIKP